MHSLILPGKLLNGYVSIGRPVFNNTVHVLNQALDHVTNGELGEIYVSGRNVVSGYLDDEHEARFVFHPSGKFRHEQLYRTGDWGVIQNGCLSYQGKVSVRLCTMVGNCGLST